MAIVAKNPEKVKIRIAVLKTAARWQHHHHHSNTEIPFLIRFFVMKSIQFEAENSSENCR